MIVGTCFPGDDNDALKWVQHDAYGPVLHYWFERSRTRYLDAERLLNTRTALGERIAAIDSFDHRSVQDAHDVMAAHFRRDIFTPQPDLFAPEAPRTTAYMADQWWEFVRKEVASLVNEPTITRLFLEACVRQRDSLGTGANAALTDALRARYDILPPFRAESVPEDRRS